MNSHLSDGVPRQDCESGAAKGKQERGAAQVDALVVAEFVLLLSEIMIMMRIFFAVNPMLVLS